MSQYTVPSSEIRGTHLESLPKSEATMTEVEHNEESTVPMCLVLGRKGLVNTELRDPYTDNVIYSITDTGRGSLSSKPDYEITRPAQGNLLVGTIRFGKLSTETYLPLTKSKQKGSIENVRLQNSDNGKTEFVWKTVKSERKVVKDRWLETNDNGLSEIMTNTEVIVLELQDKTDSTADPLCIVRLYNTQPNGRFEIWAQNARTGDLFALDEIVVSAYANMEAAKRHLMSGLDPGSFRFAAM